MRLVVFLMAVLVCGTALAQKSGSKSGSGSSSKSGSGSSKSGSGSSKSGFGSGSSSKSGSGSAYKSGTGSTSGSNKPGTSHPPSGSGSSSSSSPPKSGANTSSSKSGISNPTNQSSSPTSSPKYSSNTGTASPSAFNGTKKYQDAAKQQSKIKYESSKPPAAVANSIKSLPPTYNRDSHQKAVERHVEVHHYNHPASYYQSQPAFNVGGGYSPFFWYLMMDNWSEQRRADWLYNNQHRISAEAYQRGLADANVAALVKAKSDSGVPVDPNYVDSEMAKNPEVMFDHAHIQTVKSSDGSSLWSWLCFGGLFAGMFGVAVMIWRKISSQLDSESNSLPILIDPPLGTPKFIEVRDKFTGKSDRWSVVGIEQSDSQTIYSLNRQGDVANNAILVYDDGEHNKIVLYKLFEMFEYDEAFAETIRDLELTIPDGTKFSRISGLSAPFDVRYAGFNPEGEFEEYQEIQYRTYSRFDENIGFEYLRVDQCADSKWFWVYRGVGCNSEDVTGY